MLVIYALAEVLRFRALIRQPWYEPTKIVLLVIGVISSFAALSTGEAAEHLVPRSQLVEVHSGFAAASTWIFAVLLAAYLIRLLAASLSVERLRALVEKLGPLWRMLVALAHFILRPYVVSTLALLGLAAVTVTGALGGAIVYGPDVDPIVSFIYHLFF